MTDVLPGWEETRERILNSGAGVTEEKLDATIEVYKKKLGSIVKTKDLLYYMVAQKEYKMSMPKFSTIRGGGGGTPGGSSELISLEDLTPELKIQFVKVNVYVDSANSYPRRSGDGETFTAWVMDSTGRASIKAFKPEVIEAAELALTPGKLYTIDGLSVWQQQAEGRFKAKAQLTWTRATKVEELSDQNLKNFFPNAATGSLRNGQPCFYQGYVTDDEPTTYEGCQLCRKSMKNADTKDCGRGNGTVAECNPDLTEYTLYKASVTDGNSSFTADFGSDLPSSEIKGGIVFVIGTYDEDNSSISVNRCDVVEKNAIPDYDELVAGNDSADVSDDHQTISGDSDADKVPTAAKTSENGTKLRNITPDEVLLKFVKAPGRNPMRSVLYKIETDCNLSRDMAEAFIEGKIEDGVIKRDGDTLVWAK